MGTTAHNQTNTLGLRVRAALIGASAVYVGALVLYTGVLGLPHGHMAATPAVPEPAGPAEIRSDGREASTWVDTAEFIPALQINGVGVNRRPDI